MKEPASATSSGRAAEPAVAAATPLALRPSQTGDVGAAGQEAAATLSGPGDQAESGSYVLPLLVIVALALLAYGGIRLRRHLRRRRVAAVRREREVTWKAVVHQIETRQARGALETSTERLQKVDAA